MKQLEQLTKQNFKITHKIIGTVVDNQDTLDRGRLKCKLHGITELATIQPWCETEGDLFASSSSTIGVSTAPKVGTLVYIEFLYHNPSFPIVTGYVRGNKDSSTMHTNKSPIIESIRNGKLIGNELPPLNSSTEYPNNNVIETDTAVIEIDDTVGNERISIQHKKSGSYFEIRPDGTIQVKSDNDSYYIVKGNVDKFVQGGSNEVVTNGKTIQTKSTTHIGDFIIAGDLIVGGISFAEDHVSDNISGKQHTHPGDSGGTTGAPQ